MEMRVLSLHRHPVKGLSPEPLDRAFLTQGEFFPGDRLYAIENGPSGFNPEHPTFLPKTKFVMLMKHGRLARLETEYDDASHALTIRKNGAEVAKGDLRSAEGRTAISAFIADYCKGELRGPPKVLTAPEGFRFTDSLKSGFVSFLNKASRADLERMTGVAIDPGRFRANVEIDGLEPWEEASLVGKILCVDDLRLQIVKTIDRCAAINVRPGSGERDLDLTGTLRRAYGRTDCGFYAKTVASGPLAVGFSLTISP